MEDLFMPNLTVPPPNLSPNYNSWCYPKGTDKLKSGKPAEEQMRDISYSRREHEFNLYMSSKGEGWEQLSDGYYYSRENGKPYCKICSEYQSSTGGIQPI